MPSHPQPEDEVFALIRHGAELHARGLITQAESVYRAALRLDPACFDALHLLGLACHQQARHAEAADYIGRAIVVDPAQPVAHSNLGLALAALKRPAEAVASFEHSLQLRPGDAQTLLSLGISQLAAGLAGKALSSFEHAMLIVPDNPALLCNRGNALLALKRHEEALASYDCAIALKADFPEALNNRGNTLRDLTRLEDALASFEGALALRPGYTGALNNRGITLRDLNRQAEALASYDHALALDPEYADAHCNRGNVLQDLRRYPEALASYEGALKSNPEHAESHWNESLCRLLMGDFGRGWQKYEWRWKTEQAASIRAFAQPLWLGREDVAGKTVLLHAEQGFGDTLQFCRYAKLVAALGAEVVLEVQPPLKRLLSGLEGVKEIRARGEALPAFDMHCPLLSLPLVFNTRLETIPSPRAYLLSDPARVERWRKILGIRSRPRIGVVWSGSGGLRNDPGRSLLLTEMTGLVSGAGQFVCLQKEIRPEERDILRKRGDILAFSEELLDFADTAALVDLMDIVISVDTAVAHLAGALGKKAWILLPHAPTWRWLLDRADCPWYPSARLFRAPEIGNWGGLIAQVRVALESEIQPAVS